MLVYIILGVPLLLRATSDLRNDACSARFHGGGCDARRQNIRSHGAGWRSGRSVQKQANGGEQSGHPHHQP